MNSFEEAALPTALKEAFKDFKIGLFKAGFGESYISCFYLKSRNENELRENWQYISSSIAALYQAHLTDDYSTWNIYLLLACEESISRNLQYKIENDKFSMRKIVHSDVKNADEKKIMELLNNEILGNSLESSLLKNLPDLEARSASHLQMLITEFGEVPSDNKAESRLRRSELLEFLIQRID